MLDLVAENKLRRAQWSERQGAGRSGAGGTEGMRSSSSADQSTVDVHMAAYGGSPAYLLITDNIVSCPQRPWLKSSLTRPHTRIVEVSIF